MALAIVPFFGYSQNAQREGDVYVEQPSSRNAQETKTSQRYRTKDGKEYTIYISKNGKAYIKRISKKGNEYRQYLPEVTEDLKKRGIIKE